MKNIAFFNVVFLYTFCAQISKGLFEFSPVPKHVGGISKPVSRKAKQISSFQSFRPPLSSTYQFCKYDDVIGACMQNVECAAERGTFVGYCGWAPEDGDCCNVVKTCGGSSSAHVVRFQNPAFPNNETQPRSCILTLRIRRGICALRMEHIVFEMKKYTKDYCPLDTFTVLGTKDVSAPLCGNMTGWRTTFEVDELSEVTIAVAAQGKPPYRFSTLFTMFPCNDIVSFRSPMNAGLINKDAKEYVPTTTTEATNVTTTEKPRKITTETTTEKKQVTEPATEATTPFKPTPRNVGDTHAGPTPLPVGVIKIKPSKESVVVEPPAYEEEIGYATEYFDPTPNSILKKIYEAKVGDTCRTYDEPAEEPQQYGVPHPENISVRENGDRCWFYDPATSSYKVNEDCITDTEAESVNEGFRIIGGKHTNINEYPWQVALIYKSKFFCGGALISSTYVITASHCIFGSFSEGIHELKVSLGDHDLKTIEETDNILRGVKSVIWNLNYNPDTTENDIGLLELLEPVEFSFKILPINLPTDLRNTYEKVNATVTGWGRNSLKSKKTSSILKEYTAPIDNIDACVKKWEIYPQIGAIKDIHLCMNVTYGTPCHGDSGGPLVTCNNGPRCTLIGIVSFGFPLCTNVGLSAIFTRVTAYKRWIDINTTPQFFHDV